MQTILWHLTTHMTWKVVDLLFGNVMKIKKFPQTVHNQIKSCFTEMSV